MSKTYQCRNCGGKDFKGLDSFGGSNRYSIDIHSDTVVCRDCGFDYGGELPPERSCSDDVPPLVYEVETTPELPPCGEKCTGQCHRKAGKIRVVFKGTYRRRAHINERFCSSVLCDPIHPDALVEIENEYREIQGKNYLFGLRAFSGQCNKLDIRIILRSLEKKGKTFTRYTKEKEPYESTAWTTTFLERFKSIGKYLTSRDNYPLYNATDVAKVGVYLQKFSTIWDQWQPSGDREKRETWKFKERKHIPNLNFLYQRIHELLGPDYKKFNREFPVPVNSSAVKKLWTYWREIAKEANVPYRGQDFGQGFQEKQEKQTTLDFLCKNGNTPTTTNTSSNQGTS